MRNISSTNLFYNHDNKYKPKKLYESNIPQNIFVQDFSKQYSIATKTYACTSPNFKAKQLNNINLFLIHRLHQELAYKY